MVLYPGCHVLPSHLALSDELVSSHANGGVLVVTFTNREAASFALNWARQLQQLRLSSLVGISERLTDFGSAGGSDSGGGEEAFRLAGAGLFCADGPLMHINGQAGRWAEVKPLLLSGLDVLISDSDIAWLRNPLPYFVAAKKAHPALDFLLCTDRAFNGYSSTPLPVQPEDRPRQLEPKVVGKAHSRSQQRGARAPRHLSDESSSHVSPQWEPSIEGSAGVPPVGGRSHSSEGRWGASREVGLMSGPAEMSWGWAQVPQSRQRWDMTPGAPSDDEYVRWQDVDERETIVFQAPWRGIDGNYTWYASLRPGRPPIPSFGTLSPSREDQGDDSASSASTILDNWEAARSSFYRRGLRDDSGKTAERLNKIQVRHELSGSDEEQQLKQAGMAVQAGDEATSRRPVALELEHAMQSAISFNIGTLFMYGHAREALAQMMDAWVKSVKTDASGKLLPHLSPWDQDPINKRVLAKGMQEHPTDRLLALVFGQRLVMGVLPMLQFTTSFTFFIHRERRIDVSSYPYSLHAIFSHGKNALRKISIMREENVWHDPPKYYSDPGRFLTFTTALPAKADLMAEGGFEMIALQLREFSAAAMLASALNRTLLLPRLMCGDEPMAYPCYAWYHRAMAYFGWATSQRVNLPRICPVYYWLDEEKLQRVIKTPGVSLSIREPYFLSSPRFKMPAEGMSYANLHLCAIDGCHQPRPAQGSSIASATGGGGASILHPARTTFAALRAALAGAERADVLHVSGEDLAEIDLHDWPRWTPSRTQLDAATHGMWCNPCAITRKAASIDELQPPKRPDATSRQDMEQFCRAEARGSLGLSPYRTCCQPGAEGCRRCRLGEKAPYNVSKLVWPASQWLRSWASLRYPARYEAEKDKWQCSHPYCTGKDRQNFP